MTRLCDFAKDTDKLSAHQYIHVYEALLEPIRNTAKNVLEIGIYWGGSIRMWKSYFPNATIHCMDVHDNCNGFKGEDRISPVYLDAYSEEALGKVSHVKFDFMIDDGPHTLESQQYFVNKYSSLLSPNGILVVEDIPHPEWIPALTEATPDSLKPYSYGIDRRWVPGRNSINDELIFVIDKRYV